MPRSPPNTPAFHLERERAAGGGRRTEQKRLHQSFLERTRVKHYPLEGTVRFARASGPLKSPSTLSSNATGLLVSHFPPKGLYIGEGGGTPFGVKRPASQAAPSAHVPGHLRKPTSHHSASLTFTTQPESARQASGRNWS